MSPAAEVANEATHKAVVEWDRAQLISTMASWRVGERTATTVKVKQEVARRFNFIAVRATNCP